MSVGCVFGGSQSPAALRDEWQLPWSVNKNCMCHRRLTQHTSQATAAEALDCWMHARDKAMGIGSRASPSAAWPPPLRGQH